MGGMMEYYSTVLNNRVSAKAALAEFIGTAILVLTGTAAVVGLHWSHTVGMEHEYGLLIVATAFGIAYMTMLYSTQHTSGGQLNPAVSLALVGAGYLPLWQAFVNIAAQMLGAVVGSLLLLTVLPPHAESSLGLNFLPRHDSTKLVMQAMFAEALGAFILTFVILETLKNPKSKSVTQFPVATGLAFFLIILVFGPISSGSFNPARSFGPAMVKFNFHYFWVFFFGPILGALLAVPAHLLIVADWDTMAELHETHTSMYTRNIEDPNAPLIPTSRREGGGNVA